MTHRVRLDMKSSKRDPSIILLALTLHEQGDHLTATRLPGRLDQCKRPTIGLRSCIGFCRDRGEGHYCSAPRNTTLLRRGDDHRLETTTNLPARLLPPSGNRKAGDLHGWEPLGDTCPYRALDALPGQPVRLCDSKPLMALSNDDRTRRVVTSYRWHLRRAARGATDDSTVQMAACAWLHDDWRMVDAAGIPRRDAQEALSRWIAAEVERSPKTTPQNLTAASAAIDRRESEND